jgi:hypothetical protein
MSSRSAIEAAGMVTSSSWKMWPVAIALDDL